MKVDFIVCGTQKGGTKALDSYLREHPEICMGNRKEVHFFDGDNLFRRSPVDYGVYHAYFSPGPAHKIIGEGTPIYMYWNSVPRRMWQYNPALKLIVLLRNPIERAYSHWNMCREQKQDTLSFWEAIQQENARCRAALPLQHRTYSYVDRGFYTEQLRRLWSFFPKEQVLVLKSEDLKTSPGPTLQAVCEFLGVSLLPDVAPKDVHSLPYTSRLSQQEHEYLLNVYEFEILGLQRMLGWDCSDWLKI